MVAQEPTRGVVTRPFQATDEEQVLGLLAQALPGWARAGAARAGLWQWKHSLNPFGSSRVQVAYCDEAGIVGVLAMMRWTLRYRDRVIRATRGVDMATHPDHRGLGIGTMLSRGLVEAVRADGASVLFSTPNQASIGISRKGGRQFLGVISPSIPVRHVVKLLVRRGIRLGPPTDRLADHVSTQAIPIQSWLDRHGDLEQFLEHDSRADRFRTERTLDYLRWRYVEHPFGKYYALNVEEGRELLGTVIFRVAAGATANGIVIQEILMKGRDARIALALNKRLRDLKSVDFFSACVSHDPLERAVLGGLGLFRLPRSGYKLTVSVFDPEFANASLRLSAWGLALGDLDGF